MIVSILHKTLSHTRKSSLFQVIQLSKACTEQPIWCVNLSELRVSATVLCAQSVSDSGEDKVGVVVRCVAHRGQGSACSGQREDCGAVCETNT